VIVTIDGPAGAGKSSIAKRVAERLGFEFLDTGAMYRAVTLGAIRAGFDLEDTSRENIDALVSLADAAELGWTDARIYLNGEDVSDLIRTPEVTASIGRVADQPAIREKLSAQQRRVAAGRNIVTEGRDQGSEVFPDADCKIFLTASATERAKRRQQQLASSGTHLPFEEILAAQDERDRKDQARLVGRLRAAADAIVVATDGMTTDEVVENVLDVVQGAMNTR